MKKNKTKQAVHPEKKETEKVEAEAAAKKIKIKIIGVGGGGGNIIAELLKKLRDFSSQRVEFLAVNTDSQALKSLPKDLKTYSFGQKITKGLGTGRDAEVGEKAAREDLERIKSFFDDGRDLYIMVSSLGGGTGTGAMPVLSKLAGDMGLTTIGIFTLPFAFEGKKKMDMSLKSLEKTKENLSAFMVMPNERIFSLTKEDISFADSLNLLNDRLAEALEGLLRTVYSPGLINIDWADMKTILEGKRKSAHLNFVKAKASQNPDEIAKALLKNPILDGQFENADSVIFNIEGSKDLSLQSLSEISRRIGEMAPNAKIIFGLSQNPKAKSEIKITLFSTALPEEKKIKKPGKKMMAAKKPLKKAVAKEAPKEKDKEESLEEAVDVEVRRNALQVKEAEKKAREKEDEEESAFDTPAFLRKEKKN